MTTVDRQAARIAALEAQLDWAERIMVVLMARPQPPVGTRFDLSEPTPDEIRAETREIVLDEVERLIFQTQDHKLDLQTLRARIRR